MYVPRTARGRKYPLDPSVTSATITSYWRGTNMTHPRRLRWSIAGLSILIACSVISGLWLVPHAQAAGTITGTVYRDYNANGTRNGVEPQFAGITVTAYDAA